MVYKNMSAPAKFLFDVDFASGTNRKPGSATITLAEHAIKLAEAEASGRRQGYADAQADAKVEADRRMAEALERIAANLGKATEALQGFEQDPAVRQTLLDALQSDDNSGVRVEAINLLVSALQSNDGSATPDPRMLDVLRDRLRNDPNNYVRLQSAAALRELGEQ